MLLSWAPNVNQRPCHSVLLWENGIHIIEVMYLEELARDKVKEFLFILSPLKLVGATGSPVRPLAIVEIVNCLALGLLMYYQINSIRYTSIKSVEFEFLL
jgi:hypothetical protein